MSQTASSTRTSTSTAIAAAATDAVKVFGKGQTSVRALDGVSVDMPKRNFTAVMGPSGSGKSTLMHCMAGLDRLTSGTVTIGGVDLGELSDSELTRLRRTKVGFVFQAFNLVPTLTARENIELPLRLGRDTPDADWFADIVERLGLADRLEHTPAELSGGQQQRVAVARALMPRPDVVFADEPTGNLDTQAGARVLEMLRTAVDEFGQTIMMVTHDPNAASIADRVLFLVDGRITERLDKPDADAIFDVMRRLGGQRPEDD